METTRRIRLTVDMPWKKGMPKAFYEKTTESAIHEHHQEGNSREWEHQKQNYAPIVWLIYDWMTNELNDLYRTKSLFIFIFHIFSFTKNVHMT